MLCLLSKTSGILSVWCLLSAGKWRYVVYWVLLLTQMNFHCHSHCDFNTEMGNLMTQLYSKWLKITEIQGVWSVRWSKPLSASLWVGRKHFMGRFIFLNCHLAVPWQCGWYEWVWLGWTCAAWTCAWTCEWTCAAWTCAAWLVWMGWTGMERRRLSGCSCSQVEPQLVPRLPHRPAQSWEPKTRKKTLSLDLFLVQLSRFGDHLSCPIMYPFPAFGERYPCHIWLILT